MVNDNQPAYKQRFRVGAFLIDPGALAVSGQGEDVRLKPKAMAVLVELARQPGVTVSRDELLDRVWGNTHITPGVVGHAITALRRAFGDTLDAPTYIETIPRTGYRLLASVTEAAAPAPATAAIPFDEPSQTLIEPPAAAPPPATSSVAPVSSASPAAPEAPEAPASRKTNAKARLWWLAAAVLAAALAALAYMRIPPAPATDAPWLQLQPSRRVTFGTGSETGPRLNPAGDWLVYSQARDLDQRSDLVLQSAYGTRSRVLAPQEQGVRAAWSANGRRIAYAREQDGPCELRIVGIDDGARERIFRCAREGQLFFDWDPARPGTIALATVASGQVGGSRLRLLVDRAGWSLQPFDYEYTEGQVDLDPRFSPDGTRIAFRRGSNPTSDLYLVGARGGAVTRLTQVRARISGFDWLPDGKGLVFSSDHEDQQSLYALEIATGQVLPLGVDNATFPDVANRTWAMVYQLEGWRSALAETSLAKGRGGHRVLSPSSGRDRAAALSPDDARIAFVSDRDGSQQLWLLERGSGGLRRLTEHTGASVDAPGWSPDGRHLLYLTRARGRHQLWEIPVEGGAARRLVDSTMSLRSAVYAADGRSVWYTGWDGAAWRLHRCARTRIGQPCRVTVQAPLAARVDRAVVGGKPALVVTSPRLGSELQVLDEATLARIARLQLPINDGWSVAGDDILYFAGGTPGAATGNALRALSLRDGSSRPVAALPGMRLLRYSAPLVTRDRATLIAPVVLEDSTDLAFARLTRFGRRSR